VILFRDGEKWGKMEWIKSKIKVKAFLKMVIGAFAALVTIFFVLKKRNKTLDKVSKRKEISFVETESQKEKFDILEEYLQEEEKNNEDFERKRETVLKNNLIQIKANQNKSNKEIAELFSEKYGFKNDV